MPANTLAVLAMAAALGYLCGSLPWGLWLGRWVRGIDVRTVGSMNLGATNVYRSLGPGLGIATLLLDIAKGAVPVWLVTRIVPGAADPALREVAQVAAGLGAVAGHVWTFLAGFKGGKGVATTVGVLLALAPIAFALFAIVFVVTVVATRYVSLGSTFGAVAFAIALARLHPRGTASASFWLGLVLAALIFWRHRENYRRLLKGEERRFSFKGGTRA